MLRFLHKTAKDLSRLHQFGKTVLPGIFLGYAFIAGRIWKGDILVADIEELEHMDATEIHPRRKNAKEVSTPQKGRRFHIPSSRWYNKSVSKRDHEFREPTLRRRQPLRSEDLSGEPQGGLERSSTDRVKR